MIVIMEDTVGNGLILPQQTKSQVCDCSSFSTLKFHLQCQLLSWLNFPFSVMLLFSCVLQGNSDRVERKRVRKGLTLECPLQGLNARLFFPYPHPAFFYIYNESATKSNSCLM